MKQRCYFHKNQNIQNFCVLKQCTLPLCQECLEIHQEEHYQRNQKPKIISYNEAYNEAFKNIQNFVIQSKSKKQILLKKISKDKQKSIETIQNYYTQIIQKINKQYSHYQSVQQKFEKLIKGSIKTVIYYFSGQIDLKKSIAPQFRQISQQIQKFMQNLKLQSKQQIQTFRFNSGVQRNFQKLSIDENSDKNIQQKSVKKKSIFSNKKDRVPQALHKNTNQPYLQNPHNNPKNTTNNLYRKYPQKSQIEQQNGRDEFSYRRQKQNYQKYEPYKQNINTKNILISNEHIINQNTTTKQDNLRKTLDKYPSMIQLKNAQHFGYNFQNQLVNHQDLQFKPGKWTKGNSNYRDKTLTHQSSQIPSFSKIQVKSSKNQQIQNQLFNRKPLTTEDLKTYNPSQTNNLPFQSRERAFSHQTGLRTTYSHTNLPSSKMIQPLLNQNLKRQVLSPNQIRKMLQKKIQERNKILIEKKQHTLKINTDRMKPIVTSNNFTANNLADRNNRYENSKISIQDSPGKTQSDIYRKTIGQTSQIKTYGYNTKDSIINQIYRETRY